MVINIIIALLAFFLAGAVPLVSPGVISFVIWCVILFLIAGVGYSRAFPGQPARWYY